MLNRDFDICFIVDLSKSMEKWFSSFENNFILPLEEFMKMNKYFKIRLGFVGYRKVINLQPYHLIDLTENLSDFKRQIRNITPSGGEGCKNLNDAYHYAHKMNWYLNNRIIIHLFDSPNHGLKYHDYEYPDMYPLLNHHSPLELHIKRIASDGIVLVVYKLNASTEKTISIIEDVYLKNNSNRNKFHIIDMVSNPNQFESSFPITVINNIIVNMSR